MTRDFKQQEYICPKKRSLEQKYKHVSHYAILSQLKIFEFERLVHTHKKAH